MITQLALTLGMRFFPLLVQESAFGSGSFDERAKRGISLLLLIFLIPLIPLTYFIFRSIYRVTLGRKKKRPLVEDYLDQACKFEKAGEFVSAAYIYENRLKDHAKAASLYEMGKDFERAALLYGTLDMLDRAREMYEQAGDFSGAAEICLRQGEYEEAAKLYEKAGKEIDAAVVLERAGRRLASVRLYREAGEYRKAAEILKEEGMAEDAADMFGLSLVGKTLDETTIDDYYTFAVMLEKGEKHKHALEVFEGIHALNPSYGDVEERLKALRPEHRAIPAEAEIPLPEGKTTLRRIIGSGRTEPRYATRLWVQILKALTASYAEGRPFGIVSPDTIVLDANNASYLLEIRPAPIYVAPEIGRGIEPDERSDIYSMGIILFEMLTGDTENVGSRRAGEIAEDVPGWLDEIAMKCIKKVREDRYQRMEEIFETLKNLSKGKP